MIELKITGDTFEQVFDQINTLMNAKPDNLFAPTPFVGVDLSDKPDRTAFTTVEPTPVDNPADVYGPGNGPVDQAQPIPTPFVERIAPGAIASAPAEVDERGVPWNEEFHASTKTKTNDGAWKKKRGGDPEALAAYEAQFTTVAPVSNLAPVTHPAPGFPSPVNTMPQSDDPEPAASVPGHPGVVATPTPIDAAGVMKAASALIQNGTKTPAYLQQLAEGAGLNNIGEMFSNDGAVSAIAERLRADGFLS